MIRQGDKAQTNYRYFKTLPGKAKSIRMHKNVIRMRPFLLRYIPSNLQIPGKVCREDLFHL